MEQQPEIPHCILFSIGKSISTLSILADGGSVLYSVNRPALSIWHSLFLSEQESLVLVKHVSNHLMPCADQTERSGGGHSQVVHCLTADEFPDA